MEQLKNRMKMLGVTQRDMVIRLYERGIKVYPPELCAIFKGIVSPKGDRVIAAIKEILAEMERPNE